MGFKTSSKAPLPPSAKKRLSKIESLENQKYQKVSYRQKGTAVKGTLVKGHIANTNDKTANVSVPSKFETQLFDNNHEKKAFGSKSIRFFEYVNEDPGPGSYSEAEFANLMGKSKQSHSKRGFGNGFISKVDRFPSEIDYKAYFLPGPNTYNNSLPSTRDASEGQNSVRKVARKAPELGS